MKVALIGGTGNAGSRILQELVSRGHVVTVIVRQPDRVPAHANVLAKKCDVGDVEALTRLIAGHDAVISAVHFLDSDPAKLIESVRNAEIRHYLVVGGAGGLDVGGGKKVIDTGGVPAPYVAESRAGIAFLEMLRQTPDVAWTFLSPSAEITPGERTGTFRIGGDTLLRDANGRSWISFEDYAVAIVDEMEVPRHLHERFTVGY